VRRLDRRVPTTGGRVARVLAESARLNERLGRVVPGGAHSYAKGTDQYPEGLAPVIARGKGAHVWDVDGNRYVEYGSGLRSVALGHAHPQVNAAVRQALPHADMVKFAKNGSDATTAAVRLARAVTGRDLVAHCRDHRPSNLVHATLDAHGEPSQAFRTLFLAELLDRGVIAPSFVVSAALTDHDIDHTAQAVCEACRVYRKALDEAVAGYLRGRPVEPALRPYA
jgi:glutamate-1-semialdehyde aminotransferase